MSNEKNHDFLSLMFLERYSHFQFKRIVTFFNVMTNAMFSFYIKTLCNIIVNTKQMKIQSMSY